MVRFDLDEPVVAKQLYMVAASLRGIGQLELLASRALETVLSLARAERGNVQLADPVSGELRIIAQHGFGLESSTTSLSSTVTGRHAGGRPAAARS